MKIRCAMGFAMLALTVTVRGQQPAASELLFKSAVTREVVDGDLKGAIALYQKAADDAKGNRPVAAKALLALGMAYEKLGTGDPRAAFERVVREFGDQKDASSAARARLSAMGAAPAKAQSDGASPRRVAGVGDALNVQAISADGSLVATGSGQDLLVRNVLTGQIVKRLAGSATGRGAGARFSPDGRAIAYTWTETSNGTIRRSLGVIGLDAAATPRILLAGSPTAENLPAVTTADVREIVNAVGWSSDGRQILVESHPWKTSMGRDGSQFAWVSVADGSVRIIKTFQAPHIAQDARLSPDGRFVAYVSPRVGQTETTISVLDLAVGEEADVVRVAGLNRFPRWMQDGSHLLFTSDRSGTPALWTVPIQNGKAVAEPFLVKNGVIDLLGVSTGGSLAYVERTGGGEVNFVADRGADGSARIVQTLPGFAINWSPDGKWMAFMRYSKKPPEVDLIVRSVQTGEERLYQHQGLARVSVRWFHQRSAFQAAVSTQAQRSFCVVDVETRAFAPCFPSGLLPFGCPSGMSADDKTCYATRGNEIVAMDPLTGAAKVVANIPVPFLGNAYPSLSPDGRRLALFGRTEQGQARLVTIGIDGSDYRELVASVPATRPAETVRWTPDGNDILYVVTPGGPNWRIMRISASGGQPQVEVDPNKLTADGSLTKSTIPVTLVVSSDGRQIGWDGTTDQTTEIWAIDNIMSLLNKR